MYERFFPHTYLKCTEMIYSINELNIPLKIGNEWCQFDLDIFWHSFLEIIATENRKFRGVGLESKNKRTLESDHMNAVKTRQNTQKNDIWTKSFQNSSIYFFSLPWRHLSRLAYTSNRKIFGTSLLNVVPVPVGNKRSRMTPDRRAARSATDGNRIMYRDQIIGKKKKWPSL
jgi:hypothetical protein